MPGLQKERKEGQETLHVDLVKLDDLKDSRAEDAEKYGPARSFAAIQQAQIQWVDARLQTYDVLHPGTTTADGQTALALTDALMQWRLVGSREQELKQMQARATVFPTVAGPSSLLQRRTIPHLHCRKQMLKRELERCKASRVLARAKSARDLLKQGQGDLGAQRLPVSMDCPGAEPFVHSAILSAASRSSMQLFQTSRAIHIAEERLGRQSGFTRADKDVRNLLNRSKMRIDEGPHLAGESTLSTRQGSKKNECAADDILMNSAGEPCMTSNFVSLLRDVALANWHPPAPGLHGLPCLNHEILPLLCYNPLEPFGLKLQAKIPSTAIMHGAVCTSFIENNDLDNLVLRHEHKGVPAEALAAHFQLMVPARRWSMTHGGFIAKRLHVDGAGESLQYVSPTCGRAVCFRECVRCCRLHDSSLLRTFSTTAIPPTGHDLEELLNALNFVKPDTITTVQRFIPCAESRAHVLRVIRERSGLQRRFLIANRLTYLQNSSKDLMAADVAESRLAIAIEHATSARRVDIEELSPVGETDGLQEQKRHGNTSGPKRQELEARWADSTFVVEQIFELLCLRGARGAPELRNLARKSRYGDAPERSPLEPAPEPGPLLGQALSASAGLLGPLIPVRMAVDLMRDANGSLVLLQIKDVEWGTAKG